MTFKSEFEEGLTPNAYKALLDQAIDDAIDNHPSFGDCLNGNCPFC